MNIEAFPNKEKQNKILQLLQFGTVMVFVDSRNDDVKVPQHLKNDYQLKLNFDYDFNIADFRVLEDRLEASLLFDGQRQFCSVPFPSIYMLLNHETNNGYIFPESVPIEMLEFFAQGTPQKSSEEQSQQAKKESPFKVVTSESKDVHQSEKTENNKNQESTEEKSKKRPHLRVIK